MMMIMVMYYRSILLRLFKVVHTLLSLHFGFTFMSSGMGDSG